MVIAASCPALVITSNVVTHYSGCRAGSRYPVGAQVSFSCNSGYNIDGASKITCQSSRQWNSGPPRCRSSKEKLFSITSYHVINKLSIIKLFIYICICRKLLWIMVEMKNLYIFFRQKKGRSCFPSTDTVKIDNGSWVRMSELQIGDYVQTGINLKHRKWHKLEDLSRS